MSPTEEHNWAVTKATLESMQAEIRGLRYRADVQDGKLLELQTQLHAQSKTISLIRAKQ